MNIKIPLRRVYHAVQTKHASELGYWRKCFRQEGGVFANSHYQKLLMAMAGEADQSFLHDKVVADFGCGPRGSLSWIHGATALYGIDVLIPQYLKHFGAAMKQHRMVYIACTERCIPIPDSSIDVLFTLNAMDHVHDFPLMCSEINRILKPGGELIGSFNLNEIATAAEPQSLTTLLIDKYLLQNYRVVRKLISAIPNSGYLYQPLMDEKPLPENDAPAILWVRAIKDTQ